MKKFGKLQVLFASTFLMVAAGSAAAQENSCRPSAHTDVPLRAETAYSEARESLLAIGWQPIQSVRWQEVDKTLDSDAKARWRSGQKEVEGCVMSSGECRFLFKDIYNNYLRVTTVGEAEGARVSRFEFVCAP